MGRAASNYADHRGTLLAAAISYYTLFSLFPLTLLAFSIFGLVLRDEALQVRVLDAVIDFLPVEDDAVARSLRRIAEVGPTLTIFSFIGAAWTAAALSAAIRQALNLVFDAHQKRPFLRAKLIDYALLPIIALPLLGGVVVTAITRLMRQEIAELFPVLEAVFGWTWTLGTLGLSFLLSFTAFALIYWLLPNKPLRFRYLFPGALVAAAAFEALKGGFTFYLANFANYDVLYGSLGSVIILLFWVFLTANILVLGAEVAAETPRVLYAEPQADGAGAGEGRHWRHSLWRVIKGLVMVPDDEEAVARRDRAAPSNGAEGRSLPPQQDAGERQRETAAARDG